jgi:hypothetical protein
MPIPTHRYGDGSITPVKLSTDILEGGFGYYKASIQPQLTAPNGYGAPTGVANDLNRVLFPGTFPLMAQYHVKGTQALLGPLLDTTGKGLDISQDQADNDGVEYMFGANNSAGPFSWTVGSQNGFIEMSLEIADVTGTDDCALGFRKVEAAQANIDDYDEAAFVNIILGDIKVETILNGGTTSTTDTTQNWADGETHTLRADLTGRSVTFALDGAALTNAPAYAFDVGEVVLPFFFFLQATTAPGKVWWKWVKVGRQRADDSHGDGG